VSGENLDPEALRFLEGVRVHIAAQLERIAADNDLRARLAQEELDRRLATVLREDAARDKAARDMLTALALRLDQRLADNRGVFETRLDGMDKAGSVLAETVNRTPTAIQTAVASLRDVYDERFGSIEKIDAERFSSIAMQFRERDVRTEQAAKGGKEALDAALLAAKDLVAQQNEANRGEAAKTEQNFTKQIDAQAARIDELKERIDRGEGQTTGVSGQRNETRMNMGMAVSVGLLIVTVLTLVVLYVAKK